MNGSGSQAAAFGKRAEDSDRTQPSSLRRLVCGTAYGSGSASVTGFDSELPHAGWKRARETETGT